MTKAAGKKAHCPQYGKAEPIQKQVHAGQQTPRECKHRTGIVIPGIDDTLLSRGIVDKEDTILPKRRDPRDK